MSLEDDVRAALTAEKSWSLAEIAKRAGMHVTGLSRFKNGHTSLTVPTLEKLAAVLGLTIIVKKSGKKA